MLTKYILHIGETDYELHPDDLKNWGDIECSLKRDGIGGLIRSFSSEFEFVNKAKELLLQSYIQDGFDAKATISVHTINDNWVYEERFSCPLDFSTLSLEDYILKLNSVDSSLAALIKANRGTKYEYLIGEDIKRDAEFNFDRLKMLNSVTYEFTQGSSVENKTDILVVFTQGRLPWVGSIGSEVSVNGRIDFTEDQKNDSETENYLLSAFQDVDVTLESALEWKTDTDKLASVNLAIRIRRNGEYIPIADGDGCNLGTVGNPTQKKIDPNEYTSPSQLPTYSDTPYAERFAIVGDIVYRFINAGTATGGRWINTEKTRDEYFVESKSAKSILHLKAGDKVVLVSEIAANNPTETVTFKSSKIAFTWEGRGDTIAIDAIKPKRLAMELIRRITETADLNVDVDFSDFDKRFANTYLLAAESIRGLEGAKIYSSFGDFCDWMETVFGYTYYLGDLRQSPYKYIQECGLIEYTPWSYSTSKYSGEVSNDNIVYIPAHGKFLYRANSVLYADWNGADNYNDKETGYARKDTLFRILELSADNLYYFSGEKPSDPLLFDFKKPITCDLQTIHFIHRSELFNPNNLRREIEGATEVRYNIDTNYIYSSVTIGYEKQDFDSINGRDEFNFNNTYTTGCIYTDKTLTLTSKYRADSYGIEFKAQKRGEDTSDSSTDESVFFVLCKSVDGALIPDRTANVENAVSETVFNGAFSPIACVKANEGYIGMQSKNLKLTFASSTGNSDITVDGVAMTSDLELGESYLSAATLEFTTDEVDHISDVNELLIVANKGVVYEGYISEVDVKYARSEAAKYKLLVKAIRYDN